MSDDQLRRLARGILDACLLLALIGVGVSAALHLFLGRGGTVIVTQLPLREPVRLPPDAITVAMPTDERAAPAVGATGTADLPALPIPPALADRTVAAASGIGSARPFVTTTVSPADRGRALQCLTAAIYYEAASEPDAGQQAVAQIVLNRVRHPAFPPTVCGVVYQGSERAGCQFSFACDGAMARASSRDGWARAARVAAIALAGRVFAPVGLATHYHTDAVTPSWNRALVMTDVVGTHFFHRSKGYWRTAATFSRRYRGGEPVPGPHPQAQLPVAPCAPGLLAHPVSVVVEPSAARPPVTPSGEILPAYGGSSTPLPTAAKPGADDSQILPRWRYSGKLLRP